MMVRLIMPSMALMLAGLFAGCGDGADAPPDVDMDRGPLTVAVSIPPQAWLVEQLAPGAEVITVLSPGQSPHSYSPTDAQITAVMDADLYLRIGVPFERGQWMRAIASSGRVKVVDQGQNVPRRHMGAHGDHDHDHGHHHHSDDPHIWTSPDRLAIQATNVRDALAAADPDRASDFHERCAKLLQTLDELDRELRSTLEPVKGKAFFVFHPSWGYFAEAYGLKQVPIEIEGKEPSDSELTALIERARAENIDVIFVQPQVTGKAAKAIADAVGAEVATLDPLAKNVPANLRSVARAVAGEAD